MADPMLHLDALRVCYGARAVLDGLSLAPVEPSTMVGLLGPNGVGKSTQLRALARVATATGRADFGGFDLLRGPRRDHMRQVGYLPQVIPQSSSLLAYEAVHSALRATCGGLSDTACDQRLQQVFTRLWLHTLAMSPLDRLSGGQRQMVGLAQVLVRNTPLLLLDEPTSALDLWWQLLALEAVSDAASQRWRNLAGRDARPESCVAFLRPARVAGQRRTCRGRRAARRADAVESAARISRRCAGRAHDLGRLCRANRARDSGGIHARLRRLS
ncbi:ABC transporter ATP-binding protein [Burkholderia sp. ABCPW 11]|uniref:ATP-binding cassette domain-containing protein n=1 Tax=Burkholderia sp. ABCPW 11 TaxID=1637859 RepID=UPI000A7143FD|nr:ABC transporter ATP-binding protein [Burkholderia sp. ABCPW 11]